MCNITGIEQVEYEQRMVVRYKKIEFLKLPWKDVCFCSCVIIRSTHSQSIYSNGRKDQRCVCVYGSFLFLVGRQAGLFFISYTLLLLLLCFFFDGPIQTYPYNEHFFCVDAFPSLLPFFVLFFLVYRHLLFNDILCRFEKCVLCWMNTTYLPFVSLPATFFSLIEKNERIDIGTLYLCV